MITQEQYDAAVAQRKDAEQVINDFHKQRQEAFDQRMKAGAIFTDDELYYSATSLCPCGHGLAYPKDCGAFHYWDCSAILKGIADMSVQHTDQLPFSMYDVKGESDYRGTTRGVFRPRTREAT